MQTMSTGFWSNLDTFALKIAGLNKPTEAAGRGKVGHGWRAWWGGGEKESRVAGDQSIIAPVGLYWLCSPTGLPRSMCFQAFCVGRWRSVPGLTLTFYRDMCGAVYKLDVCFFLCIAYWWVFIKHVMWKVRPLVYDKWIHVLKMSTHKSKVSI